MFTLLGVRSFSLALPLVVHSLITPIACASDPLPANASPASLPPAAVVEILSIPPASPAAETPLEPGPDPFRFENACRSTPLEADTPAHREDPMETLPVVHRRVMGVLLSEEGIILTDLGGLETDWELLVRDRDGTRYRANLLAADPQSRLAAVKVEDMPADPLATVPIADRLPIEEDEPLETFCFTMDAESGIAPDRLPCEIHARAKNCTDDHTGDWFPIRRLRQPPACQGSPVLAESSEKMIALVLGVTPEDGLSDDDAVACGVTPFFQRAWKHLSRGRIVPYGLLGVVLENGTDPPPSEESPAISEEPLGVVIQRVLRGSPAESAGLYAGDRLLALEGHSLDNTYDLSRQLENYDPNTAIELTYSRLGKRETTELSPMKAPLPDGAVGHSGSKRWRGLRVDAISAQLPLETWMEHGIRWFDDGVVVTDVAEDSPAQRAGFREGMLLSHLRGRPTTSIERFETIIAELAGTVEATVVKKGAAGATESRLEIEGEMETLAEETSDES